MPLRLSLTELKLAVRMMRRQLLLTLTSALALATGIALATTGFTVMDAVLFSQLPFPNGDRWVLVEAYEEPTAVRTSLDVAQLRTLTGHVQGLEHVGAISGRDFTILRPSVPPIPVRGTLITPSSFSVLPYAPVIGRTLVAADAAAGAEPVAVIRESLWRRHFAGDPATIGTTANISGTHRTIVGVLPDDSRFSGSGEIWVPFPLTSDSSVVPFFRVFGVLRPGVAPEAATSEVASLARGFVPSTPGGSGIRLQVTPFHEALSRGMDLLTGATTIALVLVLVVIAGNISTLTLARAASRSAELAIRTALGASRGRLIAQILAETAVIALPAAAIGLAASQVFLRWVTASADEMPFWIDFTASPRTMLFVVILTVLVSWITGVIPGIAATRGNTVGVLAAARHRPALGRAGAALIALQVALSIAFLNGAMTMARGVAAYGGQVLAIPGTEVLTAVVSFDPAKPRQHRELLDAIRELPGVRAAGFGTSLPRLSPATERIEIEPAAGDEPAAARLAPVVSVSDGFLEALGGHPIAGRAFAIGDVTGPLAQKIAVVNEPFVRRFFNGANPVGRRLRIVPEDGSTAHAAWREIVGVVPDLGLSAGDVQLAGGVYIPMDALPHISVAIRADADAARLAIPLQQAIAALNPSMQVRHVIGLDDVGLEDRRAFAGIGGAMLAIGAMTLGLSGISLYALLALSVSQRTRETGIRVALGASRLAIVRALIGGAAVTLIAGVAAGVGLATLVVELRGIFAFRLPDGSGPWGPPAIAVVLLLSGLIAAWAPARRALAIQPADALRQD